MSYSTEGDKRQKLIQWDEETIAEHDRERGSRQKIDEAPTPFRYSSESDHSENECESDGSDIAGLKQKKIHRIKPAEESHMHFNFVGTHGETHVSPPQKSGSSVEDSWEAIHAKLNYQKHLQDISDGHTQGHEHYLNGGVGALGGVSSSSSTENHAMMCEDEDREAVDDDRQTEFGELVETEAAMNTRINKRIGITSGHNSNRNSATRNTTAASTDVTAATSAVGSGVPPISSASPRTNVFSKTTATGTDHSILKRHSRFSGSGNSSNPPSLQSTTAGSHHSHTHHHHNIHFSNSPLGSPFPGSRSTSMDNIHSNGTTQSIFAGLNGSIGGDSSVAAAAPHHRKQLSAGGGGGAGIAMGGGGHVAPSLNGGLAAMSTDSQSGDEGNLGQFKNKRAGHYNEYKVLQAMRMKMAAEEDSDEDDEPAQPKANGNGHH